MSSRRFNPKLESLRGLAALAVCFTHSISVYRLDQNVGIWSVPVWKQSFSTACLTQVNAIFNPEAAVILFFILSGYVLTQSMMGGVSLTGKDIGAFYLRRCFRILPMMWVSIIVTYAFSKINHASPADQVSSWYTSVFEQPIKLHDLLNNFFLIDFRVSPVTWTMRIELLGSLLMPAIVYIISRCTHFRRLLFFGALCILPAITQSDFQYLICFYIGALLTSRDIVAACTRSAFFLVIGGVVACAFLRLSLGFNTHPRTTMLLTTAGAASILLGVLASSSKFKILETGAVRLLGRLSYSLYLLHPATLGLCSVAAFTLGIYPLWPAALCNTALFFISTTVALAFSALSYRWIELPSIALGKSVTKFSS